MPKPRKQVEQEADNFILTFGENAMEQAQTSARAARNQREKKLAYHYTQVALRIAQKTGRNPTVRALRTV